MLRSARMGAVSTLAVAVALLVTGCGSSAPQATIPTPAESVMNPPGLQRYYEQRPTWVGCGDAQCAHIDVPLDYAEPDGDRVSLAVTRIPATGDRIGSLFINPGGPGGSATTYARAASSVVSEDVLASYDLVGVDPRGVASSQPIRCLTDAQTDELLTVDGTPETPQQEQRAVEVASMVGTECASKAGPLLGHMGTVDAARDLDIVRAVVGDEAFNYLGKSYGTLLGATYAELFPARVGRMVLDGVLSPQLGFEDISHDQAIEFQKVLRDFMRDCLASDGCPFSGSVDDALAQFDGWIAQLEDKPVVLDGRALTGAVASYAVLANLYFPHYDYPVLRSSLDAAMNHGEPTELFALLDDRISRGPDGRYLDNSTDAFYAVSCLDRPFDGTVNDVRARAAEWAQDSPQFGESLAWGLLACKDWPVTGERLTDITAAGANPILLVSTALDPATPHHWAESLRDSLDTARLVTWDSVNHTAYHQGSACIDTAVDGYLLTGALPETDVTCD